MRPTEARVRFAGASTSALAAPVEAAPVEAAPIEAAPSPVARCPHCGTPVEGSEDAFCCHGCEIAAAIIQGAGLTGWLSPRAFAMTLYHEPRVFALAPDGTEHDLAVLTGSPTLGAFVTISAVFTKAGSGWTASGCALVPPAIPARPAPHPAVTVDASGRLRADGVALNDQTGAAIGGVEAADGSY